MNLRLRLGIEWLLIALFATVLVFFANRWEGAHSFDHLLYDQLSSVARPTADDNTLLVNIDDRSLATIGKWPWPRSVHAELISKLQAATPRSIALDVILSENGDPVGDAALAEAMSGDAPVIMPLHFVSPGSEGREYDVVPPAPVFAEAVTAIGQVNLTFDSDGVLRRAALCFDPEGDGKSWPHLMEQVYRASSNDPSRAYRQQPCGESLLIPFSKRGSHTEISYSDILEGSVPAELIAGRDVIIGASATGMGDSFPVPFGDGGLLAGSEIMANMLRAIKQDSFIQPVAKPLVIALSLLPMWLLMIGFLRWSPRTTLAVSLTLIALILLGSGAGLGLGFWFPPSAALLGLLLVYPLWGWRRLQAMSAFMATELRELEDEGETLPIRVRQADAGDLVGRQSQALAGAIDHMRDLRLFVSDTLSDLPDPMVVTDVEGRITLTNDLVDRRLQRSIRGLLFKDVMENAVIPEQREAVFAYIDKGKSEGTLVLEEEGRDNLVPRLEFIRFNATRGDVFVMRQSAIESANGELQGYIYYLADITALATAEAEREQVLQLLSHDMRAPQSAIIASLEGQLDEEARKRIERNARRTMRLAQDFVDMARMGESEFSGEDVLLANLLRDVADNFWPLAKERGLSIEVEDKSKGAFVLAEPDGLSRAFSNLIDNAIKFSTDDSIVHINIDRVEQDEAPYLRINITNSGDGIAPDILPRLFQRFVTGGQQSGRVKGTGLGLNYVQAVVKRHGGSISAENIEEGGARFSMVLPEAVEGAQD